MNNRSDPLQPITVLIRFTTWDAKMKQFEKEERYPGYLTGGKNAMYVVPNLGTLIFAEVEPTDDPAVFLEVTPAETQLGNINDAGGDMESIISKLTIKLHNMTGYDFLAKVMVHVREDFDYEGAIIPKLLSQPQ